MGDIVDQILDDMFNPIFDGFEEEENFRPPKPITCYYCKRSGYHWKLYKGKFKLFTKSGKLHSCLHRIKWR